MCASRRSRGCFRVAGAYSCSGRSGCTASPSEHCVPADPDAGWGDMADRSIPSGAPIRVVGDVHGDAVAFRYATATDRFVVQLGDLTDYGPDNAAVLRIMFRLIDEG